jgi:hypothetical protein
MGSSMSGSTKSKTTIPKWIEDSSKKAIERAKNMGQMGYVPYSGPEVAAVSPSTAAGWNNQNNAANAFGMAAPENAMAGMPQAQSFAGGVDGYSGIGLYRDAMRDWRDRAPGQYDAWMDQFIDPKTGKPRGQTTAPGKKSTPEPNPNKNPFVRPGPKNPEWIDRNWTPPGFPV